MAIVPGLVALKSIFVAFLPEFVAILLKLVAIHRIVVTFLHGFRRFRALTKTVNLLKRFTVFTNAD